MLSHADNELLCRVGPGTPMGELLRQYWIPALPSSEFPGPDSPPKRMKLLGENLVMFRDSNGDMGTVVEACPHRGASMYFGRNEECGLRCGYHGWKFDITGACLETPTEPTGSSLKDKVRITAYPSRDVNHMVWVYMGPRETPPPFPAFEINTLPPENVGPPSIMMEEANYLQNMEGDLDSVHLDFLHSRLAKDAEPPPLGTPGFWNPDKKEAPRLDVVKTDYGVYYSAMRTLSDGDEWHRVNQFIFPFHTMITGRDGVGLRSFVPLDDHYAMLISQSGHPTKPVPADEWERVETMWEPVGGYIDRTNDPRTYFMTKANKRNDYERDLEVEKTRMYNGIPFVGNLQDRAMTELMVDETGTEPIYDRPHEHLGASDKMVIAVRQQLVEAVERFRDEGIVPANVDNVELDRIRHGTFKLPPGADWQALSKHALLADSGEPVAAELPTVLT